MTAAARFRASFLRACELDVAVRKPGNVSRASPGHRMQAAMFIASAQAAVGPLLEPGARVGERIEAAVAATWSVAGCNTNLGILLLCAPVAAAVERRPDAISPHALREAVETVLAGLDVADAEAAYRGIAQAQPGGLGTAPTQDVLQPPSVDLRSAMTLAASRDSVARQYRDGYADLFGLGLTALGASFGAGAASSPYNPSALTIAAVQRVYLALLSRFPDSHIVRNHGESVAQTVMAAAQAWQTSALYARLPDAEPAFAEWDDALKEARINPGTTADLTVATLLIAGLTDPG